MIPLQLVIFAVGLVALYFGAKWLVTGASSLALRFGVRPLIIGITIVALATSMPEFVVNLVAAITGEDSLALGNIVGSNISNIGLILGVSALVIPLSVARSVLRKEYPIMMGVMVFFYVISLDGTISQVDGILLIAGLISFLLYLIRDSLKVNSIPMATEEVADAEEADSMTKRVLYILAGMLGLSLGARLMVYAAVNIAEQLSIDPIIIGLTVVAIGTSLPELAASLACALNKQADMSVGNVIGSNLLNVLFVVGLVSTIRPLHVDTASIDIHLPVMLGFSAILLPLAWFQRRITRVHGTILVVGFIGYMGYLIYLINPS